MATLRPLPSPATRVKRASCALTRAHTHIPHSLQRALDRAHGQERANTSRRGVFESYAPTRTPQHTAPHTTAASYHNAQQSTAHHTQCHRTHHSIAHFTWTADWDSTEPAMYAHTHAHTHTCTHEHTQPRARAQTHTRYQYHVHHRRHQLHHHDHHDHHDQIAACLQAQRDFDHGNNSKQCVGVRACVRPVPRWQAACFGVRWIACV